ncbi:tyrosine-type recombinase/integrase [Mariprofundus ferrooxydans]|uniref:tyrosine-type recombinase/integrase n=1 Tax=Mariprofundus ferrooxydans TaxID=314344 RepID=UPI00142F799D|nr:tyrosine-type recombinase/integrase [Mariprofundus ferrooxydans]
MSGFRWLPEHAKAFTEFHVITKGCSTTAAEKYCLISKKFFDWTSSEGLPLTRDTVEAWMKHLALRCGNRSNATRASRLSSLRTVCRWLVDRGHLPSNPCDGVPTPKFSQKAAQKFSPSELLALFSDRGDNKVISLRDRCILMLFYATGMRRHEMAGMTLDRLTLASRTGRVHIIGKGAKHRVVPFEGPIVPILKTWLLARSQFAAADEPHLFIALHTSAAGTGLGNGGLHKTLKRQSALMGLRDNSVFLHKLRSTYATDMYDEGIPVGEIRILMGHASEATTWRYIAISERHLQKSRISSSRWSRLGVNYEG